MVRTGLAFGVVAVALASAPALQPEPALKVYRLEDSHRIRPLATGSRVAAGDLLQATFFVPRGERAWLYSRDGEGVVSTHAYGMPGGRWRTTLSAFRLDDASGCEDYILATRDVRDEIGPCGSEVKDAQLIELSR